VPLVLSRKQGERIVIGDVITDILGIITVVDWCSHGWSTVCGKNWHHIEAPREYRGVA
jgi:hypothetical protein